MSNAEEAEQFYEDLQDLLELTPKWPHLIFSAVMLQLATRADSQQAIN